MGLIEPLMIYPQKDAPGKYLLFLTGWPSAVVRVEGTPIKSRRDEAGANNMIHFLLNSLENVPYCCP
jgi:hypothetical protein